METLFLKIRQIWVCLKCWVMPQARVSTRRQDIEKLGQAFTCWVMPQAQVSTRSGYHKLGASNGLWQGQYQKAGHHKLGLSAVHKTGHHKLGATSGNALGSGAVPEDRTSQSARALSEEGTQTLSLVPLLIMPLDEGLTQYTRSLQI